ncbi:peptidoglycan/LPS O-acetylase OafA/YrhL [Bradyrhizobium sp. F1.13.1]
MSSNGVLASRRVPLEPQLAPAIPLTANAEAARFRPEIAGLRAVAVLGVVLCHLKISAFDGGFVGVDIFFVISGYLISRNTLLDLRQNRFSFANFYIRRSRRILPALIFTVVVTFVVGALWLPPDAFRQLAKESTHALLSISNIQYWRESKQYFATASDQLALLHCWSLSLEEQFYLFWPALLFWAFRLGRIATIISVMASVSFALSILELSRDPQAAFFLTPFRIFEFSIGALIIFIEERIRVSNVVAESIAIGGMLAIGASYITFTSTMPFPGFAVLLPCVGAAAIIFVGSNARTTCWLANPLAQAIGAISYSLYLCHWPLIFFTRFIFGPEVMTATTDAILIAIMGITATAMYFFVEKPFVHGRSRSLSPRPRTSILGCGGTVLVLGALTHTAFLQDGWAWRLSWEKQQLTELQRFGVVSCEAKSSSSSCAFGKFDAPLSVEIVGDSVAQQYVAALDPLLNQLGFRGETLTVGGCPILIGMALKGSQREACESRKKSILTRLRSSDGDVVLTQAWGGYNDDTTISEFGRLDLSPGEERSLAQLETSLEKTIEVLAVGRRKILLVGDQVRTNCKIDKDRLLPGPFWHAPQAPCPSINRDQIAHSGERVNAVLERVAARWAHRVTLIKPVDYFCDEECPVVRNGLWLYLDELHFTRAGSQYMGQRAESVFREFLLR